MDFSIRLARAAAIMTWLSLVIGVAAATLMHELGEPAGVTVHLYAVYAWSAFGVVVTTFLTFLPKLAAGSHVVLANIGVVRTLLCASIHIWVTALAAVTGGVRGPFWICYFGVVLFAAMSMTAVQAALFGLSASVGLVVATALLAVLLTSSRSIRSVPRPSEWVLDGEAALTA